jgi:hypothetical protein
LLGPEGVELDGSVTPELLLSSDFAVTRELVRCTECSHRATLEDARKAADLPTDNVLWEDTDLNIKKPIVCPLCKNNEHFTRDVIRLTQETEYVTVTDGNVQVVGADGAPIVDAEVRLRYACTEDVCEGTIVLRSADYVLTTNT